MTLITTYISKPVKHIANESIIQMSRNTRFPLGSQEPAH